MTKINNLISMEEAIKMKEMAYSERNLLNISKAVIDKVTDENTKELEENIEIEVRLATQEILDDFREIIFVIADNAVAAEKRRATKKERKAAKKEKRAKTSLKKDLNKESHIVLSKELKGEFTMKQVKVSKEFKVECGSELFYIAVGEPKEVRKGKIKMNLQLLAKPKEIKGLEKNAKLTKKGRRLFMAKKMTEMEILKKQFRQHRKAARLFLKEEYDNKKVIPKILLDNDGLVVKEYYGTTSNGPLVNATKPNKDFYRAALPIENEKNETVQRHECGFIDGKACEYVMYSELIQVTCPNDDLSLQMTQEGFWYKLDELISFEEPEDKNGWKHVSGASTWGPNNEKKGSKFFFSDDYSYEEAWGIIDDLTGQGYTYLTSRPIDGKKLMKNASRLNLFGTTMKKMGEIDLSKDYIVVAKVTFDAACDVDLASKAKLKRGGIDFGENINDGNVVLNAELGVGTLANTVKEVMLNAPQVRANYVGLKCLADSKDSKNMRRLTWSLDKLYGRQNIIRYGNMKGRCMMIVDADGAKLVNEKALREDSPIIDVYTLAVAKASNSRTSGQMIVKALEVDEAATVKRMEELINLAMNKTIYNKVNAKFSPKKGISHNTGALLGEKAFLKENWLYNVIKDLATFAKSACADMKMELESIYNHAMFDAVFVNSCGLVPHFLKIKDCGERGLLIETFSKDVIIYYEEAIAAIENDPNLPDSEKERELDNLLSAEIIKYPSAGSNEFLGVRYLTLKEYKERKNEALEEAKAKGASNWVLKLLKDYLENIPFGVTVYAAFNFIKNKLAGMDVDFDATLAIFDKIKNILLQEDAENILTYIDYFDTNQCIRASYVKDERRVKFNFRNPRNAK